jgi:hypothetical protein
MVFRIYQHFDPSNDKRITESDFIIDADLLVIQVSETFCSAIIINSLSPVIENSTAVLLTDVSDLLKHRGFREKGGNLKSEDELDELDQLDGNDSLGKDEKRELKQLERWKGNPADDKAIPGNGESTPPPPLPASDEPIAPPPSGSEVEAFPPPTAPESSLDSTLPPTSTDSIPATGEPETITPSIEQTPLTPNADPNDFLDTVPPPLPK